MNLAEIFFFISAGFAGCIAAYPGVADKNAWPRGQVYVNGVSVFFFIAVMLNGLISIAWAAWDGKTSWWMMLWFVLASFILNPFVTLIFGRWSGAISLFGAVVFSAIGMLLW